MSGGGLRSPCEANVLRNEPISDGMQVLSIVLFNQHVATLADDKQGVDHLLGITLSY
jgi:hypothetical protein